MLLGRIDPLPPVDPDPFASRMTPARHRNRDRARGDRAKSPELGSALVTQGGTVAAREYSGHPSPLLRDLGSPDGEHSDEDRVEPRLLDPVIDRILAQSRLKELAPRDYSVLASNQRPNRSLCNLPGDSTAKCTTRGVRPPDRGGYFSLKALMRSR